MAISLMLGSLSAGEVLLRVQQFIAFGAALNVEQADAFRIDENIGVRLPIAGGRQGQVEFNRWGFRSPDLDFKPPEGAIRIAFLGTSTTVDAYARLETSWPHLTIERLKERFPRCVWEYINAGSPTLNVATTKRLFESRVAPLKPQIAIILLTERNADVFRLAEQKGLLEDDLYRPYRPSWLAQHSLVWSKLEKNAYGIRLQRALFSDAHKLIEFPSDLTAHFEARLSDLVDSAQAAGALVVLLESQGYLREEQAEKEQATALRSAVLYMPYLSVRGFLTTEQFYKEAVNRVGSKHGALVVAVDDVVPANDRHFVDSSHFLPPGSRVFADYLAQRLSEAPGIQALADHCADQRDK